MAVLPPVATSAPLDPLDDLAAVANQLNTASDRLNTALSAIQLRLAEMSIGVARWVPLDDTRVDLQDRDETGVEEWKAWQLGFDRCGDGWVLMVRLAHFNDEDPDGDWWEFKDERPLLRASRELRLHAVRALPALFRDLQKEATDVLDCVEEAHRLAYGRTESRVPGQDETLTVPCQVSGRFLKFAPTSNLLGGGEFLSVEVMTGLTQQASGDEPSEVCHLFVTREDLTRVLRAIRPSENLPEPQGSKAAQQ
jgi:hypothetical protein